MKQSIIALALATLGMSSAAYAESVNTIANAQLVDVGEYNLIQLSAKHYFDQKRTYGPLSQLEYINTTTNVSGSWFDADNDEQGYRLGAEVFYQNVLFGLKHTDVEYDGFEQDEQVYSLGYAFSKNFLVRADWYDTEGDDFTVVSAQYTHRLSGKDYLGFTFAVDDEFDYGAVSAKYFKTLDAGNYLVLEANYEDTDESDSDYGVGAEYFFNERTSTFAKLANDGFYEIGGRHYFNNTFSVSASYAEMDDLDDSIYRVGVSAQF